MNAAMRSALLVVLLLAHPAAAWPEHGGSPARTFAAPVAGPAWGDVAVRVELPIEAIVDYILVGRSAYAAALEDGQVSIFRLDVDTGELTRLARTGLAWRLGDTDTIPLSTDGEHIFLAVSHVVVAYGLDGEPIWRWEDEGRPPSVTSTVLPFLARLEGRLFYAATHVTDVEVPSVRAAGVDRWHSTFRSGETVVAALDAKTGETTWLIRGNPAADPTGSAAVTGSPLERLSNGFAVTPDALVYGYYEGSVPGEAVAGDAPTGALVMTFHMHALHPEDGATLWRRSIEGKASAAISTPMGYHPLASPHLAVSSPAIAGASVYAKWDGLAALNLGTGEVLWQEPLGQEDLDPSRAFSPPAVTEDAIYVASTSTLYRFHRADHFVEWRLTLPLGWEFYWAPVVGADTVYGSAHDGNGNYSLLALAADDGTLRWRLDGAIWPVLGEDFLIAARMNELLVVGRTAASPAVALKEPTLYPAPGERVTLDLGGSAPGTQGEVVAYRVEWGDGVDSGWQESPRFEHAYAEAGDREGRAHVRTAGGQTASAPFTARVGAPAPNFVSEAFAPERQEMTFFVLGLVATGIGGGIGLLRLQRRRKRLAEAIQEVDRALDAARGDPAAIDRALDEQRMHARALLVGGRLDEGQHAVLSDHIEHASRARRLETVETALDFLPHRHVRAIREMLADGRISSIERAHYMTLLDSDPALTDEYKARVRAVIEAWSAHDSGRR